MSSVQAYLMAEDEGFEPSRLSSTRVRDARTRPLCESSVGDASRTLTIDKNEFPIELELRVLALNAQSPS